jgi:hypothetical protein
MNASKRNEKSQVPDGVQARVSPYKPKQLNSLQKNRHGHSRRSAVRRHVFRRIPTVSRLIPDESRPFPDCPGPCACRRIPTNPDHFPTDSRLPMLQHFAGPCDRVPLHWVMWACVAAVALQAGKHETAKEAMTWYEAV